MTTIEQEWDRMKRAIQLANVVHTKPAKIVSFKSTLRQYMTRVVDTCRAERKRMRDEEPIPDLSDEALSKAARFTDRLPLTNYDRLLHLVPRLVPFDSFKTNTRVHTPFNLRPVLATQVNVVTLAEAIPIAGTGLKLPLDLHKIGSRCSNSYFAPRRFAAVQVDFVDLEHLHIHPVQLTRVVVIASLRSTVQGREFWSFVCLCRSNTFE